MNVLMITKDLNALRQRSAAEAAIEGYATQTKHLVVIVLNTRRNKYPVRKISESLLIVPTNSYFGALAPLQAFFIARRELFFQGRLQVDVVAAEDPLEAGFAAWLIARSFGKPLQIHIGTNVLSNAYGATSTGNALRRRLARFLVRRADALHITSEGTRATLSDISTALSDEAVLAPRYMDIDAFQKEPVRVDLPNKYPQFKFIILATAPLVRSQNVQQAIRILAGLVRAYPHVGLVIVGEGPLRHRLKALAKRLGLEERIAFENWNDNLSSYYKTARAFIETAPYEEYDDSIAKAAAGSCAIVSTKVGIAPSIIEEGVSGFLCEPEDTQRFVNNIFSLIQNPGMCNTIRLNAGLAVQNFMSTDRETHLRLYRESWEKAIRARSPSQ